MMILARGRLLRLRTVFTVIFALKLSLNLVLMLNGSKKRLQLNQNLVDSLISISDN